MIVGMTAYSSENANYSSDQVSYSSCPTSETPDGDGANSIFELEAVTAQALSSALKRMANHQGIASWREGDDAAAYVNPESDARAVAKLLANLEEIRAAASMNRPTFRPIY